MSCGSDKIGEDWVPASIPETKHLQSYYCMNCGAMYQVDFVRAWRSKPESDRKLND